MHGPIDLGRIFFFAEFAIAVAGWVLEINPFDQPNVQEAKDNTNRVLQAYAESGALPGVADADDDALRALLSGKAPPHYLGVLGYLQASRGVRRRRGRPARPAATQDGMRDHVRLRAALPALHRPVPQGRADDRACSCSSCTTATRTWTCRAPAYTFGTLKNAAATGDLQTLRDHGLPAERVRLEGDPVAGAARVDRASIEELLSRWPLSPQENPLVEGLERLPVHPTTLVIFGATGDLAHRKLLPAIYNLPTRARSPSAST